MTPSLYKRGAATGDRLHHRCVLFPPCWSGTIIQLSRHTTLPDHHFNAFPCHLALLPRVLGTVNVTLPDWQPQRITDPHTLLLLTWLSPTYICQLFVHHSDPSAQRGWVGSTFCITTVSIGSIAVTEECTRLYQLGRFWEVLQSFGSTSTRFF